MGILSIIPVLGDIINKVIPDPEEKMKLQLELAKLADAEAQREHEELIAQTEVNKVEAGHRSVFVAGWRPGMGWMGVLAIGYNTIIGPAFSLPIADLGFLQMVILGMLGIGGMRSFDKVKGVSNDVLPIFKKANEPVAQPLPEKKKKKGPLDWIF